MAKILAIDAGALTPIVAAERLEAGDLVGSSAGWKRAKQAAIAIPARAAVSASAATGKMTQLATRGVIRGATGLTAGAPVYLAENGNVSATPGANFVQKVGIALSTTEWTLELPPVAPEAYITDAPEVTSADATLTLGTAGFTDEAECQKIVDLVNELKTDYNSARTQLNLVLDAIEAAGITLKA